MPDDLFRIRRATRQDVEPIARVHVASWNAAYKGIIPDEALAETDFTRRAVLWQRTLESGARVWVLLEDDLVIGFAEVRGPEVTVLYLHPGWWRLGLGRKLLLRVLGEIRRAGFDRAHLWALVENANARAFYERLGGAPGETRPVSVGNVHLLEMRYSWRLPVRAG